MQKQFYLFDPKTGERKLTTYAMLSGITGRTIKSLRGSKRKQCKMRILGCYVLDIGTPISVYRTLLEKEVIQDEVWRDIPNSRWQVSSYGRYRSRTRCQDKIIYRVPYYGVKSTSYMIGIRINGERHQLMAHEKVVELFIGEIPKGYVVYHKDGNKGNNRIENLGFITRRELMQRQATPLQRKPIVQLDLDTKESLAEYPSLRAAAKANLAGVSTIQQAMKEQRPAIGFIWITEEEYLQQCENEGERIYDSN